MRKNLKIVKFTMSPNTICLCNLSWLVSCSLWSNEIPEGWLTFYLFSLICETREIKTVTTSNYSSDILSVPNIFSRLAVNRTFYFNTFSQNTSFALWGKKMQLLVERLFFKNQEATDPHHCLLDNMPQCPRFSFSAAQ